MPHTTIIHLHADGEPSQLQALVRRTENGQQALELTGAGQSVVFWPVDAHGLRDLARRLNVLAGELEAAR